VKVHELVAAFANAVEQGDPMQSARNVMEGLRPRLVEVEQALAYVSGTGGNARQVFYRSPNLTLLKVCFPAGRRTPPHDHGTWAQILLLSGAEKNTLYRRENGRLRRASETMMEPGSVLPMRADTVHVAESVGATAAIGLHVYGGDIFELPRFMWNPETLEEMPLDWAKYDGLAKLACAAASAPLAP
jgi:predicted metal-dependent enzyme (double-stranded beta helix superfamily)